MDDRDHYRALGLPRYASTEAVRAAFLRVVREHHPDAGGDAMMSDRFQAANEAYWTLRHRERRAAYDALLHRADVARARQQRLAQRCELQPAGGFHRPRLRAGRWLFVVAILLALAALYWAREHRPRLIHAWPGTPIAHPASDVVPDAGMVARALADYPRMQAQLGVTGIIGFLRQCFGELGWRGSPGLFDYCATIDALAAQEWGDRPGRGPGGFFQQQASEARIDAVTVLPRDVLRARWHALQAMTPIVGADPPPA